MTRTWMFAVVTALSASRIPTGIVLATTGDGVDVPSAAPIVACLTWVLVSDNLDGYLARRYGVATQFGYVLDGFCDRCFYVAALSGLVALGEVGQVIASLLIIRELAVYAARTVSTEWRHNGRLSRIASKASHFVTKTMIIARYMAVANVLPDLSNRFWQTADAAAVLVCYLTLIPMFHRRGVTP